MIYHRRGIYKSRGQAIHSDTCRCSAGWGGSKMICSQVQPGAGAQVLTVKEPKGVGGRWYIQAGAGAEQGGAGGFRGRMPDAEASHSLLSPSRPSSPMGVQENQTIVIFFWYEILKSEGVPTRTQEFYRTDSINSNVLTQIAGQNTSTYNVKILYFWNDKANE